MRNKITPIFQQVFFSVIFFTFLSGASSMWLASQQNLSREPIPSPD